MSLVITCPRSIHQSLLIYRSTSLLITQFHLNIISQYSFSEVIYQSLLSSRSMSSVIFRYVISHYSNQFQKHFISHTSLAITFRSTPLVITQFQKYFISHYSVSEVLHHPLLSSRSTSSAMTQFESTSSVITQFQKYIITHNSEVLHQSNAHLHQFKKGNVNNAIMPVYRVLYLVPSQLCKKNKFKRIHEIHTSHLKS